MQDLSTVQSVDSRPAQSRDDKLAILRKAGYSEGRIAALSGEADMPPVLDDVVEMTDMEMTADEIGETVAPLVQSVIDSVTNPV